MNKPNPVGRPTVMSQEIIFKLEEAFRYGANDKEACFISGISRTTFYEYCKENPEFIDRIEDLKNMTKYIAKKNIARAVEREDEIGGGTSNSIWYAERKAKDEGYAVRTEVTGKDGKDLIPTDPELKAKADQALDIFLNDSTRNTN